MERLTPEQVASGYERSPGAPNAQSLRKDHLQAREDVQLILRFLEAAQEDGAVDWERWEELIAEVGL